MSDTLKLLDLNIEGDLHWDTVLPFIEREDPDVLCLQEIFEDQLGRLSNYSHQSFLATTRRTPLRQHEGEIRTFGIAIVSKLPFAHVHSTYYWKPTEEIPVFIDGTIDEKRATYRQGYIAATVTKNGAAFTCITTHFTWTPHGYPDQYQRDDMHSLRTLLKGEGDYILTGDFNIPRGVNELWNDLVEGHSDHIPTSYGTSMDTALHRYHGDRTATEEIKYRMVDYLLTTHAYGARDVRLVDGVSDHKAIVGAIFRHGTGG